MYVESEGSCGGHSPSVLRSSLTPAKKVDVDRTIMPDGTIVTTVTTVQSRPKECNPGMSRLTMGGEQTSHIEIFRTFALR